MDATGDAGSAKISLSIHPDPMVALLIEGADDRVTLAAEVSAALGCRLPDRPGVDGDTVQALWAGEDRWMLVSTDQSRSTDIFSGALGHRKCILLDQSSGWLLCTIRGPASLAVLRKGLQIDIDPAVFKPGCAALTVLDHMWTCVWCPPQEPGAYRLLVRRSFSRAFRHWFEVSAVEFGFAVTSE
jgi:heterotetrameric sarcosine oxidase gamma subunit